MIYQLANELEEYFKREFNYKRIRPRINFVSHTICFRTVKIDVYLRYRVEKEKLIIARLGFKRNIRQGHGTNFLKLLCTLSSKFNYNTIELEQTNEASSQFAKKFGFVEYEPNQWKVEVVELNKIFFC